ncbi:MAG: 4-hydroxy-3-methylbut-2-enyl diphosphate reductase [Betaproteobacteria bacterium]|nr:4-hydroxy-3-methylbut-2-enyl diphosphate reductase [Betaproteobacteria bacterium]
MSLPRPPIPLILANPRGFCAGVDRAIEIVERALERHGAPIFVRHEVVHNRFVVDNLKSKGAVFIEHLSEVPTGATVIFSAHGVSLAVRAEADARGLHVFDATCPLVTKVHTEVARLHAAGREIVMIGHRGHPEVEGTLGQARDRIYLVETPEDVANLAIEHPGQLSYVTQTTLSVDDAQRVIQALRLRFPAIQGPRKDDICYATQNRQDAVKALSTQADLVIVVGSPTSSNSNRLREVAAHRGIDAYMVDRAADLQPEWLVGKTRIGVTAGASAPEVLVNEVVERLQALGAGAVHELKGTPENVVFPLPKALGN